MSASNWPTPVGGPFCNCQPPNNKPRAVRTRKQGKNVGRYFFKCDTCKFWKWADELPGYPDLRHFNSQGPAAQGYNTAGHMQPNQGFAPQQYHHQQPQQVPQQYGGPGAPAYSPQQQQQFGASPSTPNQAPRYGQQPAYGAPQSGGPGGNVGVNAVVSPAAALPVAAGQGGRSAARALFDGPAAGGHAGVQQPWTQGQQGGYGAAGSQVQQAAGGPVRGAVSTEVLDADHLGISFKFDDHFYQTMMALNRRTTDRQWSKDRKAWSVLMSSHDEVRDHLARAGYQMEPVSQQAMALASGEGHRGLVPMDSPEEAENRRRACLGDAFWGQLYAFQQQAVMFGLERRGRMLLADEMGLGKTVQSICIAACYPQDWPLLVVCPASMRLRWRQELQRWLPESLQPQEEDLWSPDSGRALELKLQSGIPAHRPHVLVITYNLVQNLTEQQYRRYNVVLADEAHMLKNQDTVRTQFVGKVVRAARRAVLMTGTPLLSRPIEAWAQVDMLQPGLLGDYHEYGRRYCLRPGEDALKVQGNRRYIEYRGSNRLTELHSLLSAAVMLRRTKDEVANELPPKMRVKVPVGISAEAAPKLAAIWSDMQALGKAQQGEQGQDLVRKRLVADYWEATGPAKAPDVLTFLQEHILSDPNTRVLVFAHHKVVLDAIQSGLTQSVPCVRIDGATSSANRQAAVEEFQKEDGNVRVALLSILAAGMGITMTAANVVVFAEMTWNPGSLLQAEDRAHRIGQEKPVTIYYCMAPGSCDDLLWPVVSRKLEVLGAALDGSRGRGAAAGIHMQDWEQVVEGLGSQAEADAAPEVLSQTATHTPSQDHHYQEQQHQQRMQQNVASQSQRQGHQQEQQKQPSQLQQHLEQPHQQQHDQPAYSPVQDQQQQQWQAQQVNTTPSAGNTPGAGHGADAAEASDDEESEVAAAQARYRAMAARAAAAQAAAEAASAEAELLAAQARLAKKRRASASMSGGATGSGGGGAQELPSQEPVSQRQRTSQQQASAGSNQPQVDVDLT